ncbi:MAG: nucleoside 2-deoxyribosyltransferase [Candidatus Adiutrix sp.]|jgi:nucleoside 2-deoxyribosyltransferase|nr:nucleoside 2-deoxyribosyltransferase [Candidatus Adiutrix sp.]
MKTIYFAGPDVFDPDYSRRKAEIRALCAPLAVRPLLPGDQELEGAEAIFRHNLALIDQAEGVLANLNPFRGVIEPDSGTVFECAYAYARGKWVVGYLADRRDLPARLRSSGFVSLRGDLLDRDGRLIEDFGLPLNIMLAQALSALAGGLEEALAVAAGF